MHANLRNQAKTQDRQYYISPDGQHVVYEDKRGLVLQSTYRSGIEERILSRRRGAWADKYTIVSYDRFGDLVLDQGGQKVTLAPIPSDAVENAYPALVKPDGTTMRIKAGMTEQQAIEAGYRVEYLPSSELAKLPLYTA